MRSRGERVETRECDGLGRVVDNEIDAGDLLEGANVSSLTTDDAALDVIRRNLDGSDGALGRVIGGHALNGDGEDLSGLAIGFGLGARLDITDDAGGFGRALLADVVENDVTSLVLGQ